LINDHADGDGLSQRKLCEKYKVSKGAVYNILQRKDEYKYDFQMNANKGIKHKLQDDSGHKIDETVSEDLMIDRSVI
jgi:transposase